ncbi:MAG: COG4223 family protein [Methylocystis sp.]|uniref:COG4223 family protein n=1 Tax=Methylocystis sp. TaxID=1911079 RepID=UPI003DA66070
MAAPQPEKSDQASKVQSQTAGGAPAPAVAGAGSAKAAAPARRSGKLASRLLLSAAVLLALAGVAGYGALQLRETDPRVGAAADYVDRGLVEARGLIAGLTGEAPKPDAQRTIARPSLDKAPLAAAPAQGDATADAEKAIETPPPPAEQGAAPEAPAKSAEDKPVEGKPVEDKAAAESKPDALPVEKPVETKAADAAPAAPKPESAPAAAIAAAPAPAARTESRDADGFTDRDLISALEGRIDALSEETRALRERLDAPKNESRAATEAEVQRPAATSDGAAAAVVLAFALQRELEAGRPFAAEIAAFSRLGTEPAPAPVLIDVAEKGAPTGPALRDAFLPIAKKLRAQEAHADSGALTDHLLQGASKLVKVRPTGEPQAETLEGKLDRLEAALAHNDFGAATGFFDSLPEEARSEAADFGARLRQRQEAAKAADDLLSGSIAALGKK